MLGNDRLALPPGTETTHHLSVSECAESSAAKLVAQLFGFATVFGLPERDWTGQGPLLLGEDLDEIAGLVVKHGHQDGANVGRPLRERHARGDQAVVFGALVGYHIGQLDPHRMPLLRANVM